MKVAAGITMTHNPFGEDYWATCLRENLASSSYGEGLETDRKYGKAPRKSLTRQVFFKEAKQRLGLGQKQSRSFASQVFSVTQSFFRYSLLACILEHDEQSQTIGDLFR